MSEIFTEEQIARINRLFQTNRTWFPRLAKITEETRAIQTKWGSASKAYLVNQARELWTRIRNNPNFHLTQSDMRFIGLALFRHFERGVPLLCSNSSIYFRAINEIKAQLNSTVVESLLQSYFYSYPEEGRNTAITDPLRALSLEFSHTAVIVKKGYLEPMHATQLGQTLSQLEGWQEFIQNDANDLIPLDGQFAAKLWFTLFSRFINPVAKSLNSSKDPGKLLDELKLSCWLENHTVLLYEQYLNAYIKGILEPYLPSKNSLVPKEATETSIIKHFEILLGSLDDPNSSIAWSRVQVDIHELLNFWNKGRTLNEMFDHVSRIYKRSNEFEERGMWDDRRNFWLHYWRAGRITDLTLYLSNSNYYTANGKKFKCHRMDGLSGPRSVLSMIIDDEVQVCEVSSNGSLRIGRVVSRSRFWDYHDLDVFEHTIRHQGSTWRRRANEAIQELTGKPKPYGA